MSTSDFLTAFLRHAGGAFPIRLAAERVLERSVSNRDDAETALRQALTRRNAAEVAATMLSAVGHQELKDWAGTLVTPKPKTKDEAVADLIDYYFDVATGDDEENEDEVDADVDGDFAGDEFLLAVIESCASAVELSDVAARVCGQRPRSKGAAFEALLARLMADDTFGTCARVLEACPATLLRSVCESLEVDYSTKPEAIEDLLRVATEVDAVDVDEADLQGDDTPVAAITDEELIRELQPTNNPHGARPHQQVAIDGFFAERRAGRRLQAVIPTGGGKTLVGVEVAVRVLSQGGRVLWVAMDWNLLWQAARDASQRHNLYRRGALGRIGGSKKNVRVLPENAGTIRFSSVQTLCSRGVDAVLNVFRPTLVVWDECHLGQGGKLGTKLKRTLTKLGVPILGLTATPKDQTKGGYEVLPGRVSFRELVARDVLAAPVRVPSIPTGARVRARLDAFGDLDRSTIRELAEDNRRNRLIVDHWRSKQADYAKTIVFACTIQHANTLCRMFSHDGTAARVVHSHQRPEDNESALKRFREGSVQLLIGVAMLTHGIDVPDARTVVLTRPTTSDILYAQMIGRGARRTATKTTFNIVEFTDSFDQFHGKVYDCKSYFEGAGGMPVAPVTNAPVAPSSTQSTKSLQRHRFDPQGLPYWVPETHEMEELRGLWLREGQTFGLEFELTHDNFHDDLSTHAWLELAKPLQSALAEALGERIELKSDYSGMDGGEKDYSRWYVERDGSVGWEVTTPVLEGIGGYERVVRACRTMEAVAQRLGFRVNANTGLHVHLAWLGDDGRSATKFEQTRRLLRLTSALEPALATLVAPSRIAAFDGSAYRLGSPNTYAKPVGTTFPGQTLNAARGWDDLWALCSEKEKRYVTLNPRPLWGKHGTVEVRMHNGTLDAGKALLWTSVWQQILWRAEQDQTVALSPDASSRAIEPSGDIVELAKTLFPSPRASQQRELLGRLHHRRLAVVELWRRAPDLQPWLAYAQRWSSPA
jgi:superfamily II DNA or RNA helicase